MKNVNYALALGLALTALTVGCRKDVQHPTPLPGSRAGLIGGDRPSDLNPGVADKNPISSEGIPATAADRSTWPQDRETFREQTVYFDFDKANVKPSEISKLETVASQMKSTQRGKALRIEGHCDERGTEEYNRSLGERRAQSVREALVRMGIDANLIETITLGEERPADPGHTESAWSKNRRGEIVLLSPPSGGAIGTGASGNQ